jgi:hypothetical protein
MEMGQGQNWGRSEMDGECTRARENRNEYTILVGKTHWKIPFGDVFLGRKRILSVNINIKKYGLRV